MPHDLTEVVATAVATVALTAVTVALAWAITRPERQRSADDRPHTTDNPLPGNAPTHQETAR